MSNLQRFRRNVKWQTAANAAQLILGGLYLIALGRILEPSGFGLFSAVSALVAVAGAVCEMRLQDVVARDFFNVSESPTAIGNRQASIIDLYMLETGSRVLPFIGLLFGAIVLPAAMGLPESADVLIVLAAINFLFTKVGWGTSTGILRVLDRTDLIALCSTADWGLRLVITFAVFVANGELTIAAALMIGIVIGGACNALQIYLALQQFARRTSGLRAAGWSIRAALQRIRPRMRFLGANLGLSVSDLMAKDLDVAMMSSFLTPDKVGVYKMAKNLVQMSWRAIDPFYLAIMPEVQMLWSGGRRAELRILLRKTAILLFGLSIILAGLVCGAVFLLGGLILGPSYSGLVALILTMSLWLPICGPLIWGHPLAVAIGHPELAVAGSLLGSIVGVGTYLILTPLFGLHGAALAWALTLSVGFAFTAVWAVRIARRDQFGIL